MTKSISFIYLLCTLGLAQMMPVSNSLSDNEQQLLSIELQIQTVHEKQLALQEQLDQRLARADSLKASGASENDLAKFTAASFKISQQLEVLLLQGKKLRQQRILL